MKAAAVGFHPLRILCQRTLLLRHEQVGFKGEIDPVADDQFLVSQLPYPAWAFFGFQIIVNLGSMVALLPLTGVPLPFISYGGSSLVVSLACVGIILNISRQIVRKK